MKIRLSWAICGCAMLGAALYAPLATAQEEFHARVSFDAGGTLIKGNDEADWSHATVNTLVLGGDSLWVDKEGTTELEMAGGSFLRMADSSKAEISSLPPNAAVRGYTGSFYVHRLRRSSGQFTLMTPAGLVDVANDSCARIDIGHEGSTTVSVHWGRATVRAEGAGGETASDGQRIYVDPGMLPSDPEPFNVSAEDDFDQWNRERTANLVEGFKRVPAEVPMEASTVGSGDLAPYGEWVRVQDRYCWHPTFVKEYVPYRTGHWSYVSGVGYVWVEEYPFSYVTTHYGRWIYSPPYGWVWGYDPVWSPAWCATVHYGDNLLWSPIGFDNRPVVTTTSATFNVGGVLFSIAASSFVPVNETYYGGAMIRPLTPVIIQNVPQTQINVWNINVNNYHSPVHVPYVVKDMPVREFRPHALLRGPETFGTLAIRAGDRAKTLETKSAVGKFVAPPTLTATSARTKIKPIQDKDALRSVRIQPEQRVFHTQQGAIIETKPLVKQDAGGQPAAGKGNSKPLITDAPDKGKTTTDKLKGAGPDNGATTTRRTSGPQGKTGNSEPVITDTSKGKVGAQGKMGGSEPMITDNAKDKASGQTKTKTRGTTVDRGAGPKFDSGPGKNDALNGNAKDAATGQGKTKTHATTVDHGPGAMVESDPAKSDALTGSQQNKTRKPVDRTVVNKAPVIEDTTTPKVTGSGDPGKSVGSTRRTTTVHNTQTDNNVSKTGPSGIKATDQPPALDTTKGKTPPMKTPPDTARGKATGRPTDIKTIDKNKKKTTGKPGQDSSDDSTDDKVVR